MCNVSPVSETVPSIIPIKSNSEVNKYHFNRDGHDCQVVWTDIGFKSK